MIGLPNGSAFEKLPGELEEHFRRIWTLNADALSILYTGTTALKTDFTRTGSRTKLGVLNDSKQSVVRYVLNNFYDGHNQNCYDVVLAKIDLQKQKYVQGLFNPFVYCILLLTMKVVFYKRLFDFSVTQIPDDQLFKFYASFTTFVFITFSVVKRIILSNHQSFVQMPIINHFYN